MRGYRTGTRTRVRERRFGAADYVLITGLVVTAAGFAMVAFFAPALVF